MPRKSPEGNFILSAGEIGAYCVCPQAWRLSSMDNVHKSQPPSTVTGQKLHKEWAAKYDDALFLTRGAKLLVALLALACVIYALT